MIKIHQNIFPTVLRVIGSLFLMMIIFKAEARRPYQNIHALYSEEFKELESSKFYITDYLDSLSYSEIKNLDQSLFTPLSLLKSFEDKNKIWVNYKLINLSEDNLDLVLKGGRNAKETYYLFGKEYNEIKKTGYLYASSERDIARRYDTKIHITLSPNELVDVYVLIENDDGLPLDVRASVQSYSAWSERQKGITLFEGFFTGILLLIVLLNGFIYGFSRRKVFIYYLFYALTSLIYFSHVNGFLELYLHPATANAIPFVRLLPFLIAGLYFVFARHFLEINENKDWWNKGLLVFSFFCIILYVAGVIYYALTGNAYNITTVMYSFIVITALVAIMVVIKSLFLKNTVAKYYAAGTSLLMVAVIIASMNQLLYVSEAIPILVQIGLLIELIIFCAGLSHKFKEDYENHLITQQSLILELTKNEKFQKGINQELEEVVANRTQYIKEQNLALSTARKEAETATKAKSDFLSVMSHEIRTPLNAIISLAHIMELDNKDEEMQEFIDALKFSAESLHSLINDILDYNKIEAGKLRLESVEFSLIDLLKNIRESFKYKANSQGIELLVEIGEHLPDQYKGDPTRLAQIFNNLISNAIKFTNEGHVKVRANLQGVKDDKATVQFTIEDTGIGIPEDKIQSIFEEFEQASQETTRKYGGTGLGLSITKKLLDLMGSEITIKSTEGEGSTFSFSIDFEISQDFDLVNLQLHDRDKDLKEMPILVVDDNDMNRLVLKRLFTIWNAQFIESNNGNEAIDLSDSKKFNVILMDLQMKPLDGFETTKHILSKSKKNSDTPIIAMSANQITDFDELYYNTGFEGFVHKPFDPEELYARLEKYKND